MMSQDANLRALQSLDVEKRLSAIEALVDAHYVPVIALLVPMLRDTDPRIRQAAAWGLGEMRVAEAVPVLRQLLRVEKDQQIRDTANRALLRIKNPERKRKINIRRAIEEEEAEEPITPEEAIQFGDIGYPDETGALPGFAEEYDIPAPPVSPAPPNAPDEYALDMLQDEFEDEFNDDDTMPLRPQSKPPAIPAVEVPVVREGTVNEDQTVQFSAYYPREIIPQNWRPLNAYVFKAFAAEQIVADAERQLGGVMATMRRVAEVTHQPIPEGTVITATPFLPGFQFNPMSVSIGFFEDWHRFNFKMRAVDAPLNLASNGHLTFSVEGLIVADIPLSVFVSDREILRSPDANMTMTQKLYHAIFCSYSHHDNQIVERVERVYTTLGFDFLRDVHDIRSGEDWNARLLKLIEQADIFQLFWSQTAASSEHVRHEWEYALSLKRDTQSFIRPVYWQQPMPPVPNALGHLHFAFEPDLTR